MLNFCLFDIFALIFNLVSTQTFLFVVPVFLFFYIGFVDTQNVMLKADIFVTRGSEADWASAGASIADQLPSPHWTKEELQYGFKELHAPKVQNDSFTA